MPPATNPTPAGDPIDCQHCGKVIFTGEVIKSRVVDPFNGAAKCSWCKQWTPVPVIYQPNRHK